MRECAIDFDIELKLEEMLGKMKKVAGVLAVYVFGSYVNGKMNGLSDVDVCIVGRVSASDKENILLGELNEFFDISFFEDLPIWIKMRILREGKCLFVLDEGVLNKVKVSVLDEYLDFGPVIDEIVRRTLSNV